MKHQPGADAPGPSCTAYLMLFAARNAFAMSAGDCLSTVLCTLRATSFSGVSAALAGVAGLCIALSFTLAPAQIYAWIGVVFAVVMIGGLGNPLGALIAGAVIGIAEAITMALTAPSWAPLVSFSLLIAVLLLRPDRI